MTLTITAEAKVLLAPHAVIINGNQEVAAEDGRPSECLCPAGVGAYTGDKPFLSVESAENSIKVILCGYVMKNIDSQTIIATEFEVVPCGIGKPLMQVGALDQCRIKKEDAGVDVIEFERLPFGKDWEWIDVDYFHYRITFVEPDRIIVDRTFVFSPPMLSESQIEDALNIYEQQKDNPKYDEAFPYIMLAAAISGNEEATNKFLAMMEELKLDGAMAEFFMDALGIYRTYKEGRMEEGEGVYAEDVDYHVEYSMKELRELFK